MEQAQIGVIGGSGLYEMEGLEDVRELSLDTPFGKPSDAYVLGTLEGRRVAFLARHGKGHRLLPSEINFRANIFAFKLLGVQRIISASAVGSLAEDVHPLDIVLPDQFYDRTRNRVSTFFGSGVVAHVGFGDPVCPELHSLFGEIADEAGVRVHRGGTYVCMEGPQFSTRAESESYRKLGARVIGMTNLQEAKLAREAEICYVTLALVTDYDCWHQEEEAVSVEVVVKRLQQNAAAARGLIKRSLSRLSDKRGCQCGEALRNAILTRPEAMDPATRSQLRPLIGHYLEEEA